MCMLKAVSGLALAAVLCGPAFSQSLAELGSGPAELPPASYRADQYVDSRGCVFIRAGYGGEETWVPRVTRDRQPLCGYQPSIQTEAPVAVASAPAPEPQAPVASAAPAAPAQVAASAPATTAPVSAPVVRPAPVRVAAAPAPAAAPAAPAPQQMRTVSCQGMPANAGFYMNGANVRCGPQAIHPADGQPVLRAGAAAAQARQVQLTAQVIPEGYRPAWDDGRLNAARGLAHATPQGDAAMAALWTDTVPMEPIDPAADGVAVSRAAQAPSAQPVVTRASSTPDIAAEEAETPAPTIHVGAGHRYVEIARYSDRDSADDARLRLQQRGVATQLGGVERGGEVTGFVVLAGPFEDPQALGRMLMRVRGIGYSAAVTR